MLENGEVVDHGACQDEEVPDGVGERDSTVALEEDDAGDVDRATQLELEQASFIMLKVFKRL